MFVMAAPIKHDTFMKQDRDTMRAAYEYMFLFVAEPPIKENIHALLLH